MWSRDFIQESPVPHVGSAATIDLHAVFPEGEDFPNNPRPVPFLLSDSGLVLDTDMVTNLERIQLPAAFVEMPATSSRKAAPRPQKRPLPAERPHRGRRNDSLGGQSASIRTDI